VGRRDPYRWDSEGRAGVPPALAWEPFDVNGAARIMREDGMLIPGTDDARWAGLLADRFNDVITGESALLAGELSSSLRGHRRR
jgi:hypothetical protein